MQFFDLIRSADGQKEIINVTISENEWYAMYNTAKKQAIAGYLFTVLDHFSKNNHKPPLDLLYDWISCSEQIRHRNMLLNHRCIELTKLFAESGFESCILKGQGNALMYPDPLLRTPGDIDIWVKGKKDKILKFCQSRTEGCKLGHHHIHFPIWDDVEVEVHFTPSYTRVPRFSRRTRTYFDNFERIEIDGRGSFAEGTKIYIPSKDCNLVFQMSHMARHFFYGGIGLRQVIDYYYLLKSEGTWNKKNVVNTLRHLGLYKFAGAVMWVLAYTFKTEKEMLLVPADEKRGRLLLDEIMKGGDFGQQDSRLLAFLKKKSSTLSVIMRNIRLIHLFPEEAIWAPVMGVWYDLRNNKSDVME